MNLPEEFENRMRRLLGSEYALFHAEYEHSAWQALRFNPLKKGLTPGHYCKVLSELGITEIHPVSWAKGAYYFTNSAITESSLETCRPGKDPYHEIGLYYIQEPSAMSAASLLNVQPGERVLDLCAAPGGKSTQLAAALNGSGLLMSNEINPSRAKILSQNIERMGITNAIVTSEDSSKLAGRFGSYFHRILVDAPCSGEGMFRKNPDAIAEWSPENVMTCASRQAEILDNAAQMLMPGGTLVYSTCTFSPEENEGTIGAFLEKHPEFTVVSEPNLTSDSVTYTVPDSATGQTAATSVRNDIYNPTYVNFFAPGHPEWGDGNPALQHTHRLWPHKLQGEGHFAAVLIKAGQLPHKSTKQRANGIINKNQASLLHEFLTSTLSEPMMHWIECGSLTLFGDQLYRLPEDAPSLDGLRVLRAGLHVGTFRKNRFEPSHALALAIGSEDVRQALSLSRGEEAAKYLRGESLYVSEITSRQAQISNGWVLICIGSFSAGWGKVTGDMVKNHYPKGLRKTNK